jgi:hypothetical protein
MAVSIGNQSGKSLTEIIRTSMVDESGVVNESAVQAAEYFISFYTQWSSLSSKLSSTQSIILDQMIIRILNGEAHRITNDLYQIVDEIPDKEVMKSLIKLTTSLLSGEVLQNPFVLSYRERINAVVILDAINEIALRQLSGKAKEAASIQKWQVLTTLVGLVAGSDKATIFHLNLREALSYGA